MNAETLKAVQEERAHCIRLIKAAIPGLRALEAAGVTMAATHIKALEEAAQCVYESGTFRDACEAKKVREKREGQSGT